MRAGIVASTPLGRPLDATMEALPISLIGLPGLTGTDFRLLLLLTIRGARGGTIAAPQWELAEKLHVDRRTVRDSVARLIASGYLMLARDVRVAGRKRRIAYRLTY